MKVGILGGGLAGLVAGSLLKSRGYQVQILEAGDAPGGLCRTVRREGFVFDVGGGHILYSRNPQHLDFLIAPLGPDGTIECTRNTRILYHGRYVRYPFEFGLADLPPEENLACTLGFVEALIARRSGQTSPPDNFEDWIPYRFGREIATRFMWPYNRKVWNVPLSEMSVEWTDHRIPESGLEEVLRSALGLPAVGNIHQSRFRYPRWGGIGAVTDALAAGLKDSILTQTPVSHIRKTKDGWEVNGARYDRIISTIPPFCLVRALEGVPSEVREAVSGLACNSLLCFIIGLEDPEPRPYSWVYLPFPEDGPCNRITYLSNYSPNNAPPGKTSVLAEMTYPANRELDVDDSLIRDVVGSLDRRGLLDARKICLLDWHKTRCAYVVFTRDYRQRLSVLQRYLEMIGLDTLGRFARFEYLNMDMVVGQAMELVARRFPGNTMSSDPAEQGEEALRIAAAS